MTSIELIELGLNEIARECRIIDDVMTDDIHAGQLLEVTKQSDKAAFFDRMATQHADILKEVHEKVRDLLEFVGEYLNGQDIVSAVDLAINKTVYDLVYERTKEEDYEGNEK